MSSFSHGCHSLAPGDTSNLKSLETRLGQGSNWTYQTYPSFTYSMTAKRSSNHYSRQHSTRHPPIYIVVSAEYYLSYMRPHATTLTYTESRVIKNTWEWKSRHNIATATDSDYSATHRLLHWHGRSAAKYTQTVTPSLFTTANRLPFMLRPPKHFLSTPWDLYILIDSPNDTQDSIAFLGEYYAKSIPPEEVTHTWGSNMIQTRSYVITEWHFVTQPANILQTFWHRTFLAPKTELLPSGLPTWLHRLSKTPTHTTPWPHLTRGLTSLTGTWSCLHG